MMSLHCFFSALSASAYVANDRSYCAATSSASRAVILKDAVTASFFVILSSILYAVNVISLSVSILVVLSLIYIAMVRIILQTTKSFKRGQLIQ